MTTARRSKRTAKAPQRLVEQPIVRKRVNKSTTSPTKRQKKQQKEDAISDSEPNDSDDNEDTVQPSYLLEAIMDDKVSLVQLVKDWINSYRQESDQAVCELINFVIRLTGCPGKVNEEAVHDTDGIAGVLGKLQTQSIDTLKRQTTSSTQTVDTDSGDDLLLGKSKEYRKFRKNILQFLFKLLVEGQHHLLFDEVSEENNLSPFAETLLHWLVKMAGSSYRPFRHVATLVALTTKSALVSIRAHVTAELQTAHRQLEAELRKATTTTSTSSRRRSNPKGESARAEQLRSRIDSLTKHDSWAEAMFETFYQNIFIYRYRDIHAIIRAECLVPLATWCRGYSASYLDTEHLRYLGWALNDKDARVREATLMAIAGPLLSGRQASSAAVMGSVGSGVTGPLLNSGEVGADESVAEGIRPFVNRFLPRLVQVAAGDVDHKVQVTALKLVTQLGKHNYLDPQAKIGDIRLVGKAARDAAAAKEKPKSNGKGRRGGRGTGGSRSTFSNSLSQRLLEESSSESEADDDDMADQNNSETNSNGQTVDTVTDPEMLNIQTLYTEDEELQDDDIALACPHHTVLKYLAPLVTHTHATVRAAAAELVGWWIKGDWVTSARNSALGIDDSVVLEDAEDEDEDDDDMSMDSDPLTKIEELRANKSQRVRAKKWLLFKSVGAFLRQLDQSVASTTSEESMETDDEPKQMYWVKEQAASYLEEIWSSPANKLGQEGTAANEESMVATRSRLDTEIEKEINAEQVSISGRSMAAVQALWHKLPVLNDLHTLSAYLSWDHTASVAVASQNDNDATVLSRFALAPAEETALLQAYAICVMESTKAVTDRAKRQRSKKGKADIDEEQRQLSNMWQSTFLNLLQSNLDNAGRLLPLVYLANEVLDLQLLFDAGRTDVIEDISNCMLTVVERYGGNARLVRLVAGFLDRVDSSRLLHLSAGEETTNHAATSTTPGDLLCKAASAAACQLSTAMVAAPQTTSNNQHTDVYVRVSALRALLSCKDVSVHLTKNEEITAQMRDIVEERVDIESRSADSAIGHLFRIVEMASQSLSEQKVPERVALAALDTVYRFILWQALRTDRMLDQYLVADSDALCGDSGELTTHGIRIYAVVRQLKDDRDKMIGLCGDVLELSGILYGRLGEMAFVVLGRLLRLFTGVLTVQRSTTGDENIANVQTVRELRRSMMSSAGHSIRAQLVEFFERQLKEWHSLSGYLTLEEEEEIGECPWSWQYYKTAPSSWNIKYSRVCTLAAVWAQWLGDQTMAPAQLVPLASYTGMLGLPGQNAATGSSVRRKVGFVPLSAMDHIIQAAVDDLKGLLVQQRTRETVMSVFMASMKGSLDRYLSDEETGADAVNVGTLSRFVSNALRTAFSTSSSGFVLAPAVVGAAWAAHHSQAISYGLLEGDSNKEKRTSAWFVGLSQTVTGVLRPRHAEALKTRLSESMEEVPEEVEAAVAPYQRALEKEAAKLDAINARMAEVLPPNNTTAVEEEEAEDCD